MRRLLPSTRIPPTVCHVLLACVLFGSVDNFLAADDSSQTSSGSGGTIRDDSSDQSTPPVPVPPSSNDQSDSKDRTDAPPEGTSSSEESAPLPTELRRPLFNVTLATAARSETIAEGPLRAPRDQAREISAAQPVIQDLSGLVGVPRPRRERFRACHWPLYFEDIALERCGCSHGLLTTHASALHFFGRVPLLPYLMAVEPPCQCR